MVEQGRDRIPHQKFVETDDGRGDRALQLGGVVAGRLGDLGLVLPPECAHPVVEPVITVGRQHQLATDRGIGQGPGHRLQGGVGIRLGQPQTHRQVLLDLGHDVRQLAGALKDVKHIVDDQGRRPLKHVDAPGMPLVKSQPRRHIDQLVGVRGAGGDIPCQLPVFYVKY